MRRAANPPESARLTSVSTDDAPKLSPKSTALFAYFAQWFTDGFHRVRKDFVTYRREDYPAEMATYINRYFRGRLAVTWQGDYLKIGAHRQGLDGVRGELPSVYFQEA